MNAGTRNALMISGVLGVVGAVVVAGLMTRTSGNGSGADLLRERPGPAARPAAAVDAPGGAGASRTGISDLVQAGSKARVVSTDSAGNPVLELAFDTIEPLPDGRFAATGIDGWWRLGEQRVQVEAPAGTLVMPAASQAPESGTLSGGVTIRVLAPDEAGGVMAVQASVVIEALAFDLSTGELSTEDTVNARGRGWAAELEGLFLQFSEVRQRIQYARVVRGGAVRIGDEHGLASGQGEPAGPRGGRAAGAGDGGSSREARPEPARVDHYRVEVADRIRLESESRVIESDVLQVFARLTDGVLAGVDGTDSPDAEGAGESGTRGGGEAQRGLEASLAWAGLMELRVVEESPVELVRDELVARFMSMDRKRVVLADEASGVRAEAAGFEYAATRRAARLIGVPSERAVVVEAPGVGRAALSDLVVDFQTGRGSASGPGELLAERATGDRAPERIGWETGLTFQLGGVAAGSSEAIWLERADFTGGVLASDGARQLRGHLVRAWFDQVGRAGSAAGSDDPGAGMRLQRVTATGDGEVLAEAVSPREVLSGSGVAAGSGEAFDRIAAMELTVLFEPTGADAAVSPRLASALGQVRGSWDGNTVEGAYAEAIFSERSGSGGSDAIEVDRVMIESGDGGEVVLASADGWRATGRRATAVGGGRSATIVGSPASVVFMDAEGGQALTGPNIELRQAARTVVVNGPGTASMATAGELATAYARMQVSWRDTLVYDDAAGRAEALGGVVAVGSWPPDGEGRSERHICEGQRAVLRITPAADDSSGLEAGGAGGGERRLMAVELSGEGEPVAEADWARVETRRFVEPGAESAGERRLELLVELAGSVLRSDMREGTLDVPGAGRLVIEDRRGDASQSVGALSRFRWAGGLALDADAGRSVMNDSVSLLHRPAGATAITEMRCQRLEAWFVDEQGRRLGESEAVGAAGDLVQGLGAAGVRLERVELRGAVWISHEALEVSGDTLRYRTSDEELFIAANDGNTVTVVERASGRTFNAREVAVNLRTGAWRRSGGGGVR